MDKRTQFTLLGIILAAVGLAAAWYALPRGFQLIQEIRQLERVPIGNAGALLPGEVVLIGQAESSGKFVTSTHTKTPSLYFRYTHEVERRDSDGDTYWETVKQEQRSVDFNLRDPSGEVAIHADHFMQRIDWTVAQSFRTVAGKNRYTEWRIEPGQSLFVFGLVQGNANTRHYISFNAKGNYSPIISNIGQAETQSAMGVKGVLLLWLGLAGMSILTLGVMIIFGIHRVLVYLSALSFCVVLTLVHMSMLMMKSDVSNAQQRYQTQLVEVDSALRHMFERYGKNQSPLQPLSNINFLSQNDATTMHHYRQFIGESYRHLAAQMQAFPERILLPLWGFHLPEKPRWISNTEWETIDEKVAARAPVQVQAAWVKFAILGGGLVFLVATYMGYRHIRFKRLIENVPTSETLGVSFGLTEISGTATPISEETILHSPLEHKRCFWYHYVKEEKRGSGKNERWHVVDNITLSCPFICKDHHGEIRVNPIRAEVVTKHSASSRQGRYRYSEKILCPNDKIYTLGVAAVDKHKSDRLIVGAGGKDDPFILSNYPEKVVMLSKANLGLSFFTFSCAALLFSVLVYFAQSGGFAATDFLMAALAAPIYLTLVMLVLHYNDILFLRNRVDRNYANIEVALKKRYDLLRNLEAVANKFLDHEHELLKRVTQMRSHIKTAEQNPQQLQRFFDSEKAVMNQLNVVVEDYPKLKSNVIMQRLSSTMVRLENELALLRKGYNDAVETYNARILSVPDVVIAKLAKFQKKEFLSH